MIEREGFSREVAESVLPRARRVLGDADPLNDALAAAVRDDDAAALTRAWVLLRSLPSFYAEFILGETDIDPTLLGAIRSSG